MILISNRFFKFVKNHVLLKLPNILNHNKGNERVNELEKSIAYIPQWFKDNKDESEV